jgi:2-methylcitrate dehydratase PrpD
MLVHGRVGLGTYTPDALADERVLALARKVRYETREYDSYPGSFPGGVRITLKDGQTLEGDLPYQLGAPENPLTDEQVIEKFRDNSALAGGSFDALEESILELETRDDVHAALSQLSAQPVAA